jgi:outer membrane lipopolysaccharide assembly protein LptE/RlpB
MERLFNEQARKAMENLLLTDEKFKQSIEEKVKGQEYTLTIHVTATVKNPS